MISVKNFSFTYDGSDKKALDGVSLHVPRGSFTAVAGGSGSGKSTLLRAMAGVIPHCLRGKSAGFVRTAGLEVAETAPYELARFAGFVGEDIESQIICDTVEEEILFGLENFSVPHSDIEKRISYALGMLSIETLRKKKTAALSGGQKQKVAIAAMLALLPQILILDNPSAELDPASAENLYAVLSGLNSQGMTIAASDQKAGILCRFADNMAVMKNGKIIICAAAQNVMNDTAALQEAGITLPKRVELGARLRAGGLYNGDMPLDISRAASMVRSVCNDRV